MTMGRVLMMMMTMKTEMMMMNRGRIKERIVERLQKEQRVSTNSSSSVKGAALTSGGNREQ
jgi:hypothetical protein